MTNSEIIDLSDQIRREWNDIVFGDITIKKVELEKLASEIKDAVINDFKNPWNIPNKP